MSEKNSFFTVPQTVFETQEGPVDLPILYYDTSYVFAFFLVDEALAAAHIDDPDLRLSMTFRGKSLIALANYEYRNSGVGPYGEVGLAIPVVPRDAKPGNRWGQSLWDPENFKRDLGFKVLHLPVTTEAANAAGREIWGLPKFVTPIDVHHNGRVVDVRVADPDGGEPILTLVGRAGFGARTPQMPVMLYSRLGEQMLRTTVNGRGTATTRLGGNLKLTVGKGSHPMAQTMRALGMDGLSPIGIQLTHSSQSRLNQGTPVGLAASLSTAATP